MSRFASSSPSRNPYHGKTKHPKSRKPHWSNNSNGQSKVYPSFYQTSINPKFNRSIQKVSRLISPLFSTMRATIRPTTVLAPIVTIHSSLIVLVLHHPTSTIPISASKEARADNSYPGPHRQHQSTHTIRYLAL